MLTLNKNDVNMGLKDVAVMSRLRTVNPGSKPNAIKEPIVKDRIFSRVKQVNYQEINQVVFYKRFIKMIRYETRELICPTLIYEDDLFVCAVPNPYYTINHCHLSFVNDIENFQSYPWRIDV